jgi:hypothetical protein
MFTSGIIKSSKMVCSVQLDNGETLTRSLIRRV